MAFCQKCGSELPSGAQFCAKCGTPAGATGSENVRKQEFAGTIKKCPNCGATVGSFQGVCSECGLELLHNNVSNTLQEFIEQIEIATSVKKEQRHPVLNVLKLIGIIIISFFTMGIPLIIYLVIYLVRRGGKKNKNVDVKSIIENFAVPNNKADIMEFLLFAKNQRDKEYSPWDITASSWIRVWNTKCEQIINKTIQLFKTDKEFVSFLSEEMELSKKVKRRGIKKSFLTFTLVLICVLVVPTFFIIRENILLSRSPGERSISTSSLHISGDIAGYYNIEENSKLLFNKKTGVVTLGVNLKSIGNLQDKLNRQIDEFIGANKWQKEDCEISLSSFSILEVPGYKYKEATEKKHQENIEEILNLQEGKNRQLFIILADNQKDSLSLMEQETIVINVQLIYRIWHVPSENSEMLKIQ